MSQFKDKKVDMKQLINQCCSNTKGLTQQMFLIVWQAFRKVSLNQLDFDRVIVILDSFYLKSYKQANTRIIRLMPTSTFLTQANLNYRSTDNEFNNVGSLVTITEANIFKYVQAKQKQNAQITKQSVYFVYTLIFKQIKSFIKKNKNINIDLDFLGSIWIYQKTFTHEPQSRGLHQKIKVKQLCQKDLTISFSQFKRLTLLNSSLKHSKSQKSSGFLQKFSRKGSQDISISMRNQDSINEKNFQVKYLSPKAKYQTKKRPFYHDLINQNNTQSYRIQNDLLGAGIDPLTYDYHHSRLVDDTNDLIHFQFNKPEQAKSRFPGVIDMFSRTIGSQITGAKVSSSSSVRIGSNYTPSARNLYLDINVKQIMYVSQQITIKLQQRLALYPASQQQQYTLLTLCGQTISQESQRVRLSQKVNLRKSNYQRYRSYYLKHLPNECISPLTESTLKNIVKSIKHLVRQLGKQYGKEVFDQLLKEINIDYYVAGKKAILDYILRDQMEKVRIGIFITFKPIPDWGTGVKKGYLCQLKRGYTKSQQIILQSQFLIYPDIILQIVKLNELLDTISLININKNHSNQRPMNILYYLKKHSNHLTQTINFLNQKWVKVMVSLIQRSRVWQKQSVKNFSKLLQNVQTLASNKLKALQKASLCLLSQWNKKYQYMQGKRNSIKPFLYIHLIQQNKKVVFMDDLNNVYKRQVQLMHHNIIKETSRILAPQSYIRHGQHKYLWALNQDDQNFVQYDLQCTNIVSRNYQEIQNLRAQMKYFQKLYHYKDQLIAQSKNNFNVKDLDAKLFKLNELQGQIQQIKFFKRSLIAVIDCHQLKKKLLSQIKIMRTIIFQNIQTKIKKVNQQTLQKMNLFSISIQKQILSTQDYVQVLHNLQQIQSIQLNSIQCLIFSNKQTLLKLFKIPNSLVTYQLLRQVYSTHKSLQVLRVKLKFNQERIVRERVQLERGLRNRVENFITITNAQYKLIQEKISFFQFRKHFQQYITSLQQYKLKVQNYLKQMAIINCQQQNLKWPTTQFKSLLQLQNIVIPTYQLWNLISDFDQLIRQWRHIELSNFQTQKFEQKILLIQNCLGKIINKFKTFSSLRIAHELQNDVKQIITQQLSIIKIFSNPGLKERHWHLFAKKLTIPGFDLKQITYGKIKLLYDYQKPLKVLTSISKQAAKQFQIQNQKNQMYRYWFGLNSEIISYDDGIIFIKQDFLDNQINTIENHLIRTILIKNSPHSKALVQMLFEWQNYLSVAKKILISLRQAQFKFLSIKDIFKAEQISRHLPIQSTQFESLQNIWKSVLKKVLQQQKLSQLFKSQKMLQILEQISKKSETLSHSLSVYLNAKRKQFPRFYLITDKQLIQILNLNSQGKQSCALNKVIQHCYNGLQTIQKTPKGYLIQSKIDKLQIIINQSKRLHKSKFIDQILSILEQSKIAINKQIVQLIETYQSDEAKDINEFTFTALIMFQHWMFGHLLQNELKQQNYKRQFDLIVKNKEDRTKMQLLRTDYILMRRLTYLNIFQDHKQNGNIYHDSFDYQVLPKLQLKSRKTSQTTNNKDRSVAQQFVIKCLNIEVNYENQYKGSEISPYLIWLLKSPRMYYQLLSTINSNQVSVLGNIWYQNGLSSLSQLCGRYYKKIELSQISTISINKHNKIKNFNQQYYLFNQNNNLWALITAIYSAGVWVNISLSWGNQLNSTFVETVDLISTHIQDRNQKISLKIDTAYVKDSQIVISKNTSVFYGLSDKKINQIPSKILRNCRTLSPINYNQRYQNLLKYSFEDNNILQNWQILTKFKWIVQIARLMSDNDKNHQQINLSQILKQFSLLLQLYQDKQQNEQQQLLQPNQQQNKKQSKKQQKKQDTKQYKKQYKKQQKKQQKQQQKRQQKKQQRKQLKTQQKQVLQAISIKLLQKNIFNSICQYKFYQCFQTNNTSRIKQLQQIIKRYLKIYLPQNYTLCKNDNNNKINQILINSQQNQEDIYINKKIYQLEVATDFYHNVILYGDFGFKTTLIKKYLNKKNLSNQLIDSISINLDIINYKQILHTQSQKVQKQLLQNTHNRSYRQQQGYKSQKGSANETNQQINIDLLIKKSLIQQQNRQKTQSYSRTQTKLRQKQLQKTRKVIGVGVKAWNISQRYIILASFYLNEGQLCSVYKSLERANKQTPVLKSLIQTPSLSHISPSCLLSFGLIFVNPAIISDSTIINKWINRLPFSNQQMDMVRLLIPMTQAVVGYVLKNKNLFTNSQVGMFQIRYALINNLIRLLQIFLLNINSKQVQALPEFQVQDYIVNSFVFAAYWALGNAYFTESSQRKAFQAFIKGLFSCQYDLSASLQDHTLNQQNQWVPWISLKQQVEPFKQQQLSMCNLWIPTEQNTKSYTILIKLINNNIPIMIYGRQCGKSTLLREISNFETDYSSFIIDCHRKTCPIKINQFCKQKIIYGDDKAVLVLIDDLNLALSNQKYYQPRALALCSWINQVINLHSLPSLQLLSQLNIGFGLKKVNIISTFNSNQKIPYSLIQSKHLQTFQLSQINQTELDNIFRPYINNSLLNNQFEPHIVKLEGFLINFVNKVRETHKLIFNQQNENDDFKYQIVTITDIKMIIQYICLVKSSQITDKASFINLLLYQTYNLIQGKLQLIQSLNPRVKYTQNLKKLLQSQHYRNCNPQRHLHQFQQLLTNYIYKDLPLVGQTQTLTNNIVELKSSIRKSLSKTNLSMAVLSDEGVGIVQRITHQLAKSDTHFIILTNQIFQVKAILKIVAALRNIAYIQLGTKINPQQFRQQVIKILKTGSKVDQCICFLSSQSQDHKQFLPLLNSLITSAQFYQCLSQIQIQQIIKTLNVDKKLQKKQLKRSDMLEKLKLKVQSLFHFVICTDRPILRDIKGVYPNLIKHSLVISYEKFDFESTINIAKQMFTLEHKQLEHAINIYSQINQEIQEVKYYDKMQSSKIFSQRHFSSKNPSQASRSRKVIQSDQYSKVSQNHHVSVFQFLSVYQEVSYHLQKKHQLMCQIQSYWQRKISQNEIKFAQIHQQKQQFELKNEQNLRQLTSLKVRKQQKQILLQTEKNKFKNADDMLNDIRTNYYLKKTQLSKISHQIMLKFYSSTDKLKQKWSLQNNQIIQQIMINLDDLNENGLIIKILNKYSSDIQVTIPQFIQIIEKLKKENFLLLQQNVKTLQQLQQQVKNAKSSIQIDIIQIVFNKNWQDIKEYTIFGIGYNAVEQDFLRLQEEYFTAQSAYRDTQDQIQQLKQSIQQNMIKNCRLMSSYQQFQAKVVYLRSVINILHKFQTALTLQQAQTIPLLSQPDRCCLKLFFTYCTIHNLYPQHIKYQYLIRLLYDIYGIRIGQHQIARFLDNDSRQKFRYLFDDDSFGIIAAFVKITIAKPFLIAILQQGRHLESIFTLWNRKNFHVADSYAKYEQIKPLLFNNVDIIIYNPSTQLLDSLKHMINPNKQTKRQTKSQSNQTIQNSVQNSNLNMQVKARLIFIYFQNEIINPHLLSNTKWICDFTNKNKQKYDQLRTWRRFLSNIHSGHNVDQLVKRLVDSSNQLQILGDKVQTIILKMKKENLNDQEIQLKIQDTRLKKLQLLSQVKNLRQQLEKIHYKQDQQFDKQAEILFDLTFDYHINRQELEKLISYIIKYDKQMGLKDIILKCSLLVKQTMECRRPKQYSYVQKIQKNLPSSIKRPNRQKKTSIVYNNQRSNSKQPQKSMQKSVHIMKHPTKISVSSFRSQLQSPYEQTHEKSQSLKDITSFQEFQYKFSREFILDLVKIKVRLENKFDQVNDYYHQIVINYVLQQGENFSLIKTKEPSLLKRFILTNSHAQLFKDNQGKVLSLISQRKVNQLTTMPTVNADQSILLVEIKYFKQWQLFISIAKSLRQKKVSIKMIVICANDIQIPHDLSDSVKKLYYKSVFTNLLKQQYYNQVEKKNLDGNQLSKQQRQNNKKMIGAYYYILKDQKMRTNYQRLSKLKAFLNKLNHNIQ